MSEYGKTIQLLASQSTEAFRREKLIEECSELITALARLVTKEGALEEVVDELVDVTICIDAFNTKLHTNKMYLEAINAKSKIIHEKLNNERSIES